MIVKTRGGNPSDRVKEAADLFPRNGNESYDWQESLTREAAAVITSNMGFLDK